MHILKLTNYTDPDSDNSQCISFDLVDGEIVGENGETLTEMYGYYKKACVIKSGIKRDHSDPSYGLDYASYLLVCVIRDREAHIEHYFLLNPDDNLFIGLIEALVGIDIAEPFTIHLTPCGEKVGVAITDSKGEIHTPQAHPFRKKAKTRVEYVRFLCEVMKGKVYNLKK